MQNSNLISQRWNPPADWISEAGFNTHWFGLIDLIISLKHQGVKNASMIEIGTNRGESTALFAMSGLFKQITTIDIAFKQRAYDTDIFNNIKYLMGDSKTVHSIFYNNSVDFIYIDGDHSYEGVKADINNYFNKLKKDTKSFIGGHDYTNEWPGVVSAVDETFPEKTKQKFSDGSFLIKI